MTNTSALIVAIPSADDPINQLSTEDFAHVSLLFFGDAANVPPPVVDGLRDVVAEVSLQFGAFDAQIAGVALLGPDKASVLILESEELVDLRHALAVEPVVQQAYALADKQFPTWIPHTTIKYDGGVVEDPPEQVRIDALGLWLGDDKTIHPFGDGNEMVAAVFSMPVVTCQADLGLGLRYADSHPDARWYMAKRACAFGVRDRIPAQWGHP